MADRPFETPLPADLPEDWTSGQIVAPAGADVGLSQQHGYNYLMEQVNAAQRAINAINESFDTISGKRTCRVTVGTSTAGWAQADCDFLCDGTDDQEELSAAVAAVQAVGGGEIVILGGEYNLSDTWSVISEDSPSDLALSLIGEPSTTLNLSESGIEFYGMGSRQTVCIRNITFRGKAELNASYQGTDITATKLNACVEGCQFIDVHLTGGVVSFGISEPIYAMKVSGNRFREADRHKTPGIDENVIDIVASMRFALEVSNNVLELSTYEGVNCFLTRTIKDDVPAYGIVVGNRIVYTSSTGEVGIRATNAEVQNNTVYNAELLAQEGAVCVGNAVTSGNIRAGGTGLNVLCGNTVTGGGIVAGEYTAVLSNCVEAPSNGAGIALHRLGTNNTPAEKSPVVTGNIITAGSIGIHLAIEGMVGVNTSQAKALIASNRITGCTTSIQIESNWSECLVTGNVIDSAVVDMGTGNLVRLNSDDAGSGGGGGTAGVTSFKGRSGAVIPMTGDYTAAMVGARPDTWTPTAADVGAIPSGVVRDIQTMTQTEYDALAEKDPTTLYLIKE